jgi:hypothetical protein
MSPKGVRVIVTDAILRDPPDRDLLAHALVMLVQHLRTKALADKKNHHNRRPTLGIPAPRTAADDQ